MGGKRENIRNDIREELTGCGPVADRAVVGAKDLAASDLSAEVMAATATDMAQCFVRDRTDLRAADCTGDASACISPTFDPLSSGQPGREQVRDRAGTSRMGAFPGTRERGWVGTGPKTLPKDPQRYIKDFKRRHDARQVGSADPMADALAGMTGRRVWSDDPIRDDDRASRTRDAAA